MSMRRLIRLVRSLGSDRRGVSVVEFSLVAPVLGLLIVGIADYGRGFSERFALETAAHRTLERASVASNQPDFSFLHQEAANAAGVPIENVTYDNWLECNGERRVSYAAVCEDGHQVTRYVYIKVEKSFEPAFRWTGAGRPFRISGDAAVRVQ